MKEIPLSQGKVALVDDEDFERVNQYKWCAMKCGKTFYAVRNRSIKTCHESGKTQKLKRKLILMHRFIMNALDDVWVDHVNHNGLDNRRSANLRICTPRQNHMNQIPCRGETSKYKGVTWFKRDGLWVAQIYYKGKHFHLGCFTCEIEAAKTYDRRAREMFGPFAYCNFPEEASE